MIQAETRADDGMQLMRVETFQFSDPTEGAVGGRGGGERKENGGGS